MTLGKLPLGGYKYWYGIDTVPAPHRNPLRYSILRKLTHIVLLRGSYWVTYSPIDKVCLSNARSENEIKRSTGKEQVSIMRACLHPGVYHCKFA